MAYMSLEINEDLFPVSVLVFDALPFELLLGMDFLTRYDVTIKARTRELLIDSDCDVADEQLFEIFFALFDEVELPPLCETFIDTKCSIQSSTRVFAQGSTLLADRHSVHLGKGLVSVDDGKCSLTIANLSNKHVSLPRGTIVAYADSIEDDWVEASDQELRSIQTPNLLTGALDNLPKGLDLSNTNISAEQLDILTRVLIKHQEIFCSNSKGPVPTTHVAHEIDTGDARPINSAPYRAGHKEATIIDEQVNEMLQNNIIVPSRSPWAAPIVLVRKKDCSIRF